jgi:hypothetical protein
MCSLVVWNLANILSVALAAAMFIVTVVTYFVSRVIRVSLYVRELTYSKF